MTRKWISFTTLCLLMIIPIVALAGEGRAKKKRAKKAKMVKIRTVASISSLMVGQRIMMGELSKAMKSDPTNPKSLEKIAHLSEVLAELSNVNSVGKGKEAAYRGFSRSLRDDSLKLRDHATSESANADEMLALVSKIKGNCQTCHNQLR